MVTPEYHTKSQSNLVQHDPQTTTKLDLYLLAWGIAAHMRYIGEVVKPGTKEMEMEMEMETEMETEMEMEMEMEMVRAAHARWGPASAQLRSYSASSY